MTATTVDELDQITQRLHDEYFDPREVRHDEDAGTLEIPFRRIFHEGPGRVVKQRLLYRVDEVDVLRCRLCFFNVVSYKLIDRTKTDALSLNFFHYDEKQGIVTAECCEDCDFSISVNGLRAEYRELDYRGKARITRGFCAQVKCMSSF